MAERLKALVLKTSDTERYRGFESLSLRQPTLEKYPSGRRGSPAKGVVRVTAARVQIPASPLKPLKHKASAVFSIPKGKHINKAVLAMYYQRTVNTDLPYPEFILLLLRLVPFCLKSK